MTTITEFLLARIAEDEAFANTPYDFDAAIDPHDTAVIAGRSAELKARWIAECKAKRRIVELSASWSSQAERVEGHDAAAIMVKSQAITGETVIRALAQPYADHPDFESGWAL